MTNSREREDSEYDSDDSIAHTTRPKRAVVNYLTWVTDKNSQGKTTMDTIVDWYKIKGNYGRLFGEATTKINLMPCYKELIELLVETGHARRKAEAVRQHCIGLHDKYDAILEEFDGQGYAFTEEEDKKVTVIDEKTFKVKNLADVINQKFKYFYDLRPVIHGWEIANPGCENPFTKGRRGKSGEQMVSSQSSKSEVSNKRRRYDNDHDGSNTQKNNITKLPRVIAESDDDDDEEDDEDDEDDESSSKQRGYRGLQKWIHHDEYALNKNFLNGSNTLDNFQNSWSILSKEGEVQEQSRYAQHNQRNNNEEVTIDKLNSPQENSALGQHHYYHQNEEHTTESIRGKRHKKRKEQRYSKTLDVKQNTSTSSSNNNNKTDAKKKTRKKKSRTDVLQLAKRRLKMEKKRVALEERKVRLAEKAMALEEKKLALKEHLANDHQCCQNKNKKKKGFSLFNWLY
ncbi:hypothetical protein K501DRAFT_333300, partial [Backusella circina FSU 941]